MSEEKNEMTYYTKQMEKQRDLLNAENKELREAVRVLREDSKALAEELSWFVMNWGASNEATRREGYYRGGETLVKHDAALSKTAAYEEGK